MSIQPLFNGPLFLPSQQLIDASAGPPPEKPASATAETGPTTGNVLAGEGSDFLNPLKIQDISTDFSKSLKSATSDSLRVKLIGTSDLIGKHPNQIALINATLDGINIAKSSNVGQNIAPRANSNPILWQNPTALDILVGVTASGNNIASGTPTVPNNPTIPTTTTGNSATTTGGIPVPGTITNTGTTTNNGSNGTVNTSQPYWLTYIPINIWNMFTPQSATATNINSGMNDGLTSAAIQNPHANPIYQSSAYQNPQSFWNVGGLSNMGGLLQVSG